MAFAAIAVVHNAVFVGAVLFVDGFFLLAALPVVLDWSELHAGPERAGAAVGFLLLAGNLGGVVLVLIVQGVIGNPYLSLVALVGGRAWPGSRWPPGCPHAGADSQP